MSRLFHVKRFAARTAGWGGSGLLTFILAPALVGTPAAMAAINKCTDGTGKVIFGDLPCSAAQSAAVVKTLPATPAPPTSAAAPAKDPGEALRADGARIRAAQTPACLALADRVLNPANNPGLPAPGPAELEELISRYEQQCAAQARKAIPDEIAPRVARDTQLELAAACKEKRRVLDDRRGKLASLPDSQKKGVAALEQEVARDCP